MADLQVHVQGHHLQEKSFLYESVKRPTKAAPPSELLSAKSPYLRVLHDVQHLAQTLEVAEAI